jgi:AcrR family transcriptional regulator
VQAPNPVAQEGIGNDEIVDAALDIIVRAGLAGLTLRPLAARAGISVTAISARMGSKDRLIDGIVDLAAERDRAFFARWLALAARVGPVDALARATTTDLAFRDWIDASRCQAIFLVELVHDRALRPAPSPALDRWLAAAGSFWSTMLFGSPALADLALGYMLDEAGFALGAGNDPAYSMLRILCLQRLADGMFARRGGAGPEIERLIAALDPGELPIVAIDDPKRRRIADSAAQILVSAGIDATTHRSVALAAGVPASTVVYHFGGRAALVVAGLHAVIAHFHQRRDRARAAGDSTVDDAETRDLVKATSMIALASVRDASLLPYAIDMRRRRGENIRASDIAGLGFGPDSGAQFDRAAAQIVSIALFGMRMAAMARKVPEQTLYRSAFAALADWNADNADRLSS